MNNIPEVFTVKYYRTLLSNLDAAEENMSYLYGVKAEIINQIIVLNGVGCEKHYWQLGKVDEALAEVDKEICYWNKKLEEYDEQR